MSRIKGTIKVPAVKKKNPLGRVLMDARYRKRVVTSVKVYNRKNNRYDDRSGYSIFMGLFKNSFHNLNCVFSVFFHI